MDNGKKRAPTRQRFDPIIFNIHTNNQPITLDTRNVIYADDTATAVKDNKFELVESKLEFSLKTMTTYTKA